MGYETDRSGGIQYVTLKDSTANDFRSEWEAKLYADIRFVVETARRHSIRAIDAIRLTLQEKPIPRSA